MCHILCTEVIHNILATFDSWIMLMIQGDGVHTSIHTNWDNTLYFHPGVLTFVFNLKRITDNRSLSEVFFCLSALTFYNILNIPYGFLFSPHSILVFNTSFFCDFFSFFKKYLFCLSQKVSPIRVLSCLQLQLICFCFRFGFFGFVLELRFQNNCFCFSVELICYLQE